MKLLRTMKGYKRGEKIQNTVTRVELQMYSFYDKISENRRWTNETSSCKPVLFIRKYWKGQNHDERKSGLYNRQFVSDTWGEEEPWPYLSYNKPFVT